MTDNNNGLRSRIPNNDDQEAGLMGGPKNNKKPMIATKQIPRSGGQRDYQGLIEKFCIGLVIILLFIVIVAIGSILISTFQTSDAKNDIGPNPIKTQDLNKVNKIPLVIPANQNSDIVEPIIVKPTVIPDINNTISQGEKIDILPILKPLTDINDYKILILENDLKVLLVSDPKAEMAMAAVDVHAGSWLEPDSVNGLAHFLEHMSFISSQTYPEIGYVDDFLSSVGGYSNAYTDDHHTNYYCVSSKESFDQTAEIFAHMFIDPIFPQQAVDRESSAVNSEYEIDTSADVWKYQLVLTLIARKDHPLSRFSIGNTQTLQNPENGADVIQELINFHSKYYSSNIMSLVLYSSNTIEQLEEILENAHYETILNNNIQRPDLGSFGLPFDMHQLPKVVQMQISEDSPVFKIVVMVSFNQQTDAQKRAAEFTQYLLSFSGDGGLEQTLKNKGLIDSLDMGPELEAEIFMLFAFNFQLTRKGFLNPSLILTDYFNFIHKLRETPDLDRIFDERKKMTSTFFNYLEISGGSADYVSNLSVNLNNHAPHEVLAHDFIYEDYDQEHMRQIWDQFDDPNRLTFIFGALTFIDGENNTNDSNDAQGEFVQTETQDLFKQYNIWLNKDTFNGQDNNSQFFQYSELYKISYSEIRIEASDIESLKKYPVDSVEFSRIQFPTINIYAPDDSLQIVSLCDVDPTEQKFDVSVLSSLLKEENDENWFNIQKQHVNTIPNPEHTRPGPRADLNSDTNEIPSDENEDENNKPQESESIDPYIVASTKNGESILPESSSKSMQNRNIVTFGLDDPYADDEYYLQFQFTPFPFEKLDELEDDLVEDKDTDDEISTDNTQQPENEDVVKQKKQGNKKKHREQNEKTDEELQDLKILCMEKEEEYELTAFKYPAFLVDDYYGRLWYQLDRGYRVPEIILIATFSNGKSLERQKDHALAVLYAYLMEEELRKDFGQAMEAGYSIGFGVSESGLTLKIEGWSDQFNVVLNRTISKINEVNFSEQQVEISQEMAIKDYTSANEDDIIRQAARIRLNSLLMYPYHSPEELVATLATLQEKDIDHFKTVTLRKFQINALVMGNVDVYNAGMLMEDAIDIIDTSYHQVSKLNTGNTQYYNQQNDQEKQNHIEPDGLFSTLRVFNILGFSFVHRTIPAGNDDNPNSATLNYYQWGPRTMYNIVMMTILEVPLNLFMFDYLRTQRELGYICFARMKQIGCVDGFLIGVEGSQLLPHEVDQQIEYALIQYRTNKLQYLTEQELEGMKDYARAKFLQESKSLEEKAELMFEYISEGSYLFDEPEVILEYLEKVNENNLKDFFDEMFLINPGQISEQIYSKVNFDNLPIETLNPEQTIHGLQSYLIYERQDLVNAGRSEFNCDISLQQNPDQQTRV